MNQNIKSLLEAARQAGPPAKESRATWRPLYPVVDELLGNDYTLAQAIRWLIERGAIPADKELLAYKSIRQAKERKERKEAVEA